MAKREKYRIHDNKMTTKWLQNAIKSLGVSTSQVISEIAPNLSEATKSSISGGRDVVSMLKTSRGQHQKVVDQLMNTKYMGYAKTAYKNAVKDIKSGNLNNTARETNALLNDESTITFGDMDGEENINVSIDQSETAESINNLSDTIVKSSVGQIKMQKATMDTYISINTAAMQQRATIGSDVVNHLSNISNSLSSLVEYQNTNMNRFIQASVAFYDKMGAAQDKRNNQVGYTPEIVSANGKFNFSEYKQMVKKQIENTSNASLLKTVLDDNLLKMAASNPIGFMTTGLTKYMMPKVLTETISAMETTFTNFVPTMLSKLSELENSQMGGLMGSFVRSLGKTFGIKIKDNGKFSAVSVTKDPIPFDGETKHAITEVITKELRDQTGYLQIIASHYDSNAKKNVRSNAEIWSNKQGKYITRKDVDRDISNELVNSIRVAFEDSSFGKIMSQASSSIVKGDRNSDKYKRDSKEIDNTVTELFNMIQRSKKTVTLDVLLELLKATGASNNTKALLKKYIREKYASNTSDMESVNVARLSANRAFHRTKQEIENDPYKYNLIASSFYGDKDIAKVLDEVNNWGPNAKNRASIKRYKQGPASKSSDNGIDISVNTGKIGDMIKRAGNTSINMMRYMMNGDMEGMIQSGGRLLLDGFISLKNRFTGFFFGDKDEQGRYQNGIMSDVVNGVKDSLKDMGSFISSGVMSGLFGRTKDPRTGKWVKDQDSDGGLFGNMVPVIGDIKDSLKTLGTDFKNGFMLKIFGRVKDPNSGQYVKAEDEPNLFDSIKKTLSDTGNVFKRFLYGDRENGQKGLLKGITDAWHNNFKSKTNSDDREVEEAGASALKGTLTGGVIGAILGGPILGALAGFATSVHSSGMSIKEWFFGKEGALDIGDGRKVKKQGIIGKIGNSIEANVLKPLKTEIKYMRDTALNVLERKVLAPFAFAAEFVAGKAAKLANTLTFGMAKKVPEAITNAASKVGSAISTTVQKYVHIGFNTIMKTISTPGTIIMAAVRALDLKERFNRLLPVRAVRKFLNTTKKLIFKGIKWTFKSIFNTLKTGILAPFKALGLIGKGVKKLGQTLGQTRFGQAVGNAAGNLKDRIRGTQWAQRFKEEMANANAFGTIGQRIRLNNIDFKNRRDEIKKQYKENREHDKNSKIISRASKGQFSEDTEEARQWLKYHKPKEYEKLTGESITTKENGRSTVGMSPEDISRTRLQDLSPEGQQVNLLQTTNSRLSDIQQIQEELTEQQKNGLASLTNILRGIGDDIRESMGKPPRSNSSTGSNKGISSLLGQRLFGRSAEGDEYNTDDITDEETTDLIDQAAEESGENVHHRFLGGLLLNGLTTVGEAGVELISKVGNGVKVLGNKATKRLAKRVKKSKGATKLSSAFSNAKNKVNNGVNSLLGRKKETHSDELRREAKESKDEALDKAVTAAERKAMLKEQETEDGYKDEVVSKLDDINESTKESSGIGGTLLSILGLALLPKLTSAFGAIKSAWDSVINPLLGGIKTAWTSVIQPFISGVSSAVSNILSFVSGKNKGDKKNDGIVTNEENGSTGTTGNVINTVAGTISSGSRQIAKKLGEKTGENVAKDAAEKGAEKSAEKAAEKAGENVAEKGAQNAAKKAAAENSASWLTKFKNNIIKYWEKFMDGFKSVCKKLCGKSTDDVIKAAAEGAGSKTISSGAKKLSGKGFKNIIKGLGQKECKGILGFIKKKVPNMIGKGINSALDVSGAGKAITVIFSLVGATIGAFDAAELFMVDTEDVDKTMTTIAAAFSALEWSGWVGLAYSIIRLVIEYTLGVDISAVMATGIYSVIKGADSIKSMQSNTAEQFDSYVNNAIRDQYNVEHLSGKIDKKMTYKEYKEKVDKGEIEVSHKNFSDWQHDRAGNILVKGAGKISEGVTSLLTSYKDKERYIDKNNKLEYVRINSKKFEVFSHKTTGDTSDDLTGEGVKIGEVDADRLDTTGLTYALIKSNNRKEDIKGVDDGSDSDATFRTRVTDGLYNSDINYRSFKEMSNEDKQNKLMSLINKDSSGGKLQEGQLDWFQDGEEANKEALDMMNPDPNIEYTDVRNGTYMMVQGDTWTYFDENGNKLITDLSKSDAWRFINSGYCVHMPHTYNHLNLEDIQKKRNDIKQAMVEQLNIQLKDAEEALKQMQENSVNLNQKIEQDKKDKEEEKDDNGIFASIADTVSEGLEKAGNAIKSFFGISDSGGSGGGFGSKKLAGKGDATLSLGDDYFSQSDPRWGSMRFADDDMSDSGCGPTALAMAINSVNGRGGVTPIDMARLANKTGNVSATDGTSANFISEGSRMMGVDTEEILRPTQSDIVSQLSRNEPMVLLGRGRETSKSPYTESGHYVVATGLSPDGDVMINDPRGRQYSHEYDIDTVSNSADVGWGMSSQLGGYGRNNRKRKYKSSVRFGKGSETLTVNNKYKSKAISYDSQRGSIQYIVIHSTGNKTDTASANANFFANSNTRAAGAHYFVDDSEIYRSIDDNKRAYATQTPGMKLKGNANNANSISIEMCMTNNAISNGTQQRTAKLAIALCQKYGLSKDRIIRHYDVCGKQCPTASGWTGSSSGKWNKFKDKVTSLWGNKYTLKDINGSGANAKGGSGSKSEGISADDVIKVAKSEVGYAPSSQATKYNSEMKKAFGHPGSANWCATFATYCFYKASGNNKKLTKEALHNATTASCSSNESAFRKAGKWVDSKSTPKPGYVVFYSYSHTGIVVEVDGDNIITIEGNTAKDGSKYNGIGVVAKKKKKKGGSQIKGYGVPSFGSGVSSGDASSTTTEADPDKSVFDKFTGVFTGVMAEAAKRMLVGDLDNTDYKSIIDSALGKKEVSTSSSDSSGSIESMGMPTSKTNAAKQLYSVMHKAGVPDVNISGVLGNFEAETDDLDPSKVEGIYTEKYQYGPKKQDAVKNHDSYARKLSTYNSKYNANDGKAYPGLGLGQWTAGGAKTLIEKAPDGKWYDMAYQVDKLLNSNAPTGSSYFKGGVKNWKKAESSPEEAGRIFSKLWEGQTTYRQPERKKWSKKWYDKMQKENWADTTANISGVSIDDSSSGSKSSSKKSSSKKSSSKKSKITTLTQSDLAKYYKDSASGRITIFQDKKGNQKAVSVFDDPVSFNKYMSSKDWKVMNIKKSKDKKTGMTTYKLSGKGGTSSGVRQSSSVGSKSYNDKSSASIRYSSIANQKQSSSSGTTSKTIINNKNITNNNGSDNSDLLRTIISVLSDIATNTRTSSSKLDYLKNINSSGSNNVIYTGNNKQTSRRFHDSGNQSADDIAATAISRGGY